MTKVKIDPGICGFVTSVEAEADEDGMQVKLKIKSGCEPVRNITKDLGDAFDSYELCLVKPGKGPLFDYASQKFPVHCGCPVLSGIIKAAEAECKLALPKNASITFE